jgi:hypothetical protein
MSFQTGSIDKNGLARTEDGKLYVTAVGTAAITGGSITGQTNVGTDKVTFPATQVSSSDVNALDDYEEGTFTPGITFGGGSTGLTYTSQLGFYTKIGNIVHVNGLIQLSAKGSSTGTALIVGLPFTSQNTTGNTSAANLRANSLNYTGSFQGYVGVNSSGINLEDITEAGSGAVLDDTNFAATTQIIFQATYRAAT